ncbi:Minf_1886 family protein [Pontiella sp.]|uniref:Minf_1886 family protein n=1 Tax=Pontiella sp. TaxID=2837462 RepID=UPI003564C16A
MNNTSIEDLLAPVIKKDHRYTVDAYCFVREGLDYTVRQLEKPRHVSGQELLEGMRDYALKEYGPVSKRVLSEWGINECVDFGNIVFNLVREGLLGKTEEDSIEDFMEGYDFHEAFIQPFRPKKKTALPASVK